MKITLNIGLKFSKNYLPYGAEEMHLPYEYVKAFLEKVLGTPSYIEMGQSTTEQSVIVEYTNVEDVLPELFSLARELKQDCIAYSVQYGCEVLGGALVGEYAHQWNYGIFNEAYFIQPF